MNIWFEVQCEKIRVRGRGELKKTKGDQTQPPK